MRKRRVHNRFGVSEDLLFPLSEEKYPYLKCVISQEKDLYLYVVRVGAEEFWCRTLSFYFMAGAKLKLYKIKTCS